MKTKISLLLVCFVTVFTIFTGSVSAQSLQLVGYSPIERETDVVLRFSLNSGPTYPLEISYYWTLAGAVNWFNVLGTGSITMQNNKDSIIISGLTPAMEYEAHLMDSNGVFAHLYFITLTPSGTEEVAVTKLISIQNPVHSRLQIQSDQPIGRIRVTNLLGQMQMDQRIQDVRTTMDVADLPRGYYIVSLGEGAGCITRKVMLK